MYDFENIKWKKNNSSVVISFYIDVKNSKIYIKNIRIIVVLKS